MERNICIICAGSAEKKGTSGGSRKLLIEEICLVFFRRGGGGKRLNPTIKPQQGDQEPKGMLEHISCEMTEIVLNAVKYGTRTKSNTVLEWEPSAATLYAWTQLDSSEGCISEPPIKARSQ